MKLRHQTLIATALLLLAIACVFFVNKSQAFDGAYVGGSFGGILSPVNHLGDKVTDIAITGGGMKIGDQWHTARKPSMNFTITSGFGRLFDKHYSGIEGSINKMRYRMKISKSSENHEHRSKDEINLNLRDVYFSIDYKQGYLISPKTLVFAKAGVMRTRARMSLLSESDIKYGAGAVVFKHPSYLKHEKIIHPGRIGFGLEHKFSDNISFMCDYTYTRYLKKFKLTGSSKSVSPAGQVVAYHNHSMTIQDTSIMIGLKKYF